MGKHKIPAGWLDYHPVKDSINDIRIIPFKCPLPLARFQDRALCHVKWTPSDVMQYIPNLGLVIDLTNKQPCYYNPTDFLDNGVEYKKISCRGHYVPEDTSFQDFCDTIENFLEQNASNGDVIGVHCTHGVNRTGYMICRFMVERRNYTPYEALEAFAVCRGYPLERENYIKAIHDISSF